MVVRVIAGRATLALALMPPGVFAAACTPRRHRSRAEGCQGNLQRDAPPGRARVRPSVPSDLEHADAGDLRYN
jgi:hypothetical protein